MPVNILAQAFSEGLDSIPFGYTVVQVAVVSAVLYVLKWFFNGANNGSERNMHSKVVMVTVSYRRQGMALAYSSSLGRHSWYRR